MRAEVEAELKKSRAQRRFSEAADAFQNMVYEQPDSLKPAAERFKLKIQTSGWLTGAGGEQRGPLDNRKVLAALFSSDALSNKRNTDAIEVATGTLVAARVVEHQPAAQRKLEEVKDEITAMLQRQEAGELARKDGEAKLAELRKGAAAAGVKWGTPVTVARREPQKIPGGVVRSVMAADTSKLPAYIGLPAGEAGYLLVRISKVVEGDPKQGGDPMPRAVGRGGLPACAPLKRRGRRSEAGRRSDAARRRPGRRGAVRGLPREPAQAGRHLGQPGESGEEVVTSGIRSEE